jgi:cell division protein FtsZ
MGMMEISQAAEIVKEKIAADATFIFGANIDPSYEDKIEVTVLATGFDMDYATGEFAPAGLTRSVETTLDPAKVGLGLRKEPTKSPSDDDELESMPSFLRRK